VKGSGWEVFKCSVYCSAFAWLSPSEYEALVPGR